MHIYIYVYSFISSYIYIYSFISSYLYIHIFNYWYFYININRKIQLTYHGFTQLCTYYSVNKLHKLGTGHFCLTILSTFAFLPVGRCQRLDSPGCAANLCCSSSQRTSASAPDADPLDGLMVSIYSWGSSMPWSSLYKSLLLEFTGSQETPLKRPCSWKGYLSLRSPSSERIWPQNIQHPLNLYVF